MIKKAAVLIGLVLIIGNNPAHAESETAGLNATMTFSGSSVIENFDPLPLNSEARYLRPPILFGIELLKAPRGDNGTGFWLDAHVAHLIYTMNPAYGVSAGPAIALKNATLKLGLEIENSGQLAPPMSGGFMQNMRWAAVARLASHSGFLRPGLEFKMIEFAKSDIADLEGLPTKIGRDTAYLLRPSLQLKLPLIMGEAALSMYSLGAAAIASKEFGYHIPRQTVFRPSIGAGVDLAGFEIWARVAAVYPVRNNDPVEFLYQAPFYLNENLTARKVMTGEVRWHF
ncbi:MAG: hypothetical protein A2X94_16205 [Bdellovibrionales bacterium GWB1_55_8]|nr:MAG: hypothetical protein A2X94_16205 [Bdellovibrionales bacterium GWB1_55_8]